jgi:7,8-dihydropterin-6-yl-methyl-4-(beta-D-ribofuranosyl)aminobenzene 5'-phosphate synthase
MGTMTVEQSLIIETERGFVLVTGCAHPGIADVIEEAMEIARQNPLLVIGGFHLSAAGDAVIADIISRFRELSVMYVAPAHCTGENAMKLFRAEYVNRFIEVGVGSEIDLRELG